MFLECKTRAKSAFCKTCGLQTFCLPLLKLYYCCENHILTIKVTKSRFKNNFLVLRKVIV